MVVVVEREREPSSQEAVVQVKEFRSSSMNPAIIDSDSDDNSGEPPAVRTSPDSSEHIKSGKKSEYDNDMVAVTVTVLVVLHGGEQEYK